MSNINKNPDSHNYMQKIKHTIKSNSLKTTFFFNNCILDTKYAHDLINESREDSGNRFSVFMSIWSMKGCMIKVKVSSNKATKKEEDEQALQLEKFRSNKYKELSN